MLTKDSEELFQRTLSHVPVNLEFVQNVERKKLSLVPVVKTQKLQQLLKIRVLTIGESAKGRNMVVRIQMLTLTDMTR